MSAAVKVKPATPLPWEVLIRDGANGIAGRVDPVVGASIPRGLDAVYITHTANAYPKLVESLRWTLALLEKPNGSHSRTYRVRYEHAAALLRDLGEAP